MHNAIAAFTCAGARKTALATMILSVLCAVADSRCRITETEIEFPTYGFSDPDPVPHTDSPLYPYFRFDGSVPTSSPKKWKAVILENDKIKVTMLPEIGGKVWGAEDKKTGKAFLYYNHVVKFRNIALRGPWCSGGIEFNFGITGHAPTSATPVDWFVRQNADGSASYFAAATEYINRTTWQVEVRLAPGDEHFTTHTTWYNGANLEGPYYHWMNAAFPLPENTEFVFPGRNYVGHPGDAHEWPKDADGHNLAIYSENAFGDNKSYHVINGDNRLFGLWWPDADFGAVHRNAPYDKYGRKIWLWSPSREGAIWENLLTDSDGQYAELQSGRIFQQPRPPCEKTPFKIASFAPGGTDRFDESWGLVRSRDGFGRPEMDIRPRPVEMPKDFDWSSAQGLFIKGTQKLRYRDCDDDARTLLKAALAKNSNHIPSLGVLASLAARQARYDEAISYAERALAVDTYDGAANYVAGFSAFAKGALPTAKERLGLASFNAGYRASSFALLAKIALLEKDWNEALKLADRALDANRLSFDALHVRIVAARKSGDVKRALAFAKTALEKLPLFHAARYELGKMGCGRDFRSLVRGEFPHETYVDLGTWYEDAGLVDEAREIYGFAGETVVAKIRLAYLDRDIEALKKIGAMSASFVFPFRRESVPALEWAAKENPSWRFKYYLALFKAANGDQDGADFLLDACGDEPDEAMFYLYRAGRRIGKRKYDDVLAAERLGGGWRAGLERFHCEAESGESENALATVARLQTAYPEVNAVKLAYAKALLTAKRYADCIAYLEKCVILPSEYGENAESIWREACYALGEIEKAESYPENLGAGKPYPKDNRPYEFKRANRNEDDVRPLVDFENESEWRVECTDAAAICGTTSEEQLFGNKTMRLSYCGRGAKPKVMLSPLSPIALPDDFNAMYVWVKGNHWGHGANTDFSIPNTPFYVCFTLADGKEECIRLLDLAWPDWHQLNHRFSKKEIARLKGAKFAGFRLENGTQKQYLQIHLDNFAVFKESLDGKIEVKPRAKRNLKALRGAVLGINTGAETLPFPTRDETIMPVSAPARKDDLKAVFSGGAVRPEERGSLKVTQFRRGKSLIVDMYAPAGSVTEVCAGAATEAKVVKSFTVPYLAYGDGNARLKIDLLEGGWYRSAVFDWYRSNGSEPGFALGAQTMLYHPKTDGTYNPVSERLVITVSRDFADVLPEIPNPVSPYKAVTGTRAWRAHASYDHKFDRMLWREVKRAGIDHVAINDHETLWRDRGESFTFRTDAAPGRGGDAGAEAYSRYLRGELGYVYGPYNNYTDFAPMNANWSRDLVSRNRDGTMRTAWVRCYAPKPVFSPGYCEAIVPKAQAKFAFNTAYCDVHTAVAPYHRTDYDARVPGAATMSQTFYAWGELLLLQKKHWEGPVYSEGARHFFYSGLTDGNYAQDRGYNFLAQPWIVDFDLLRIHPKECNFGMGTLSMFSPGVTPEQRRFYMPNATGEKERDELIDLFMTATVAFGHAPFLILDYCFDPLKPFGLAYGPRAKVDLERGLPIALKSYAMIQPIAARYTQADVKTIAYFGADGKPQTSSEAIASGAVGRNQIFVEYKDGTCVVANGNVKDRLVATVKGRRCDLPPRAFKAWTKDGKVRVEISDDAKGNRTYFSDCPEFTFRNGKLTKKTSLFRGMRAPADPMPDDREAALKAMSKITPSTAEVRRENGVPALFIDGRKTPVNIYKGATDYRLMGEAGADIVLSFNCGSRLYASVKWDKALWDPKTEKFDFTSIENNLLRIHKANPRARVILAIEVSPDRDFIDAHPDEIFVNDKGERGRVHLHGFTGFGNQPFGPDPIDFFAYSYTGDAYRAYVEKGLVTLATWLKNSPVGNIVVGFQLFGGMDGQFVQWEYKPVHGHFDYSEGNRKALCRYLREIYGTDSALQKAWGDPSVTLDTAKNPTPAEFHSKDCFDDKPGFGRKLADCRRFISVGTARTLNGFAKTVKKAWGRPAVVELWWTTAIWSQTSRLALDELIKDDAVNILATVSYYGGSRAVGGLGASANNTIAAINDRNVLYIQELDHRTRRTQHVSAAAPKLHAIPSTAEEYDIQIKRDISSVIASGGQGFYFFDMFGSWFHEPEAMSTIRKAFAMNTHASKHAGMYEKPSAAIIFDEKTRLLAERTAYATPNAIWRTSGVIPAMHLLSDVDGDFPAYRLCILWNPVSITKEESVRLKRMSENGTKLVLAGKIGICSRDFTSSAEALAALGGNVTIIDDVSGLTDRKLNELAREAGARVYSEPGNVTYVGNGVACVHRIAGPATVDFGHEVTPVDPLTGKKGRPLRFWKPDMPRNGIATMCYLP